MSRYGQFVWFLPDTDVFGFRKGGKYRVMFQRPDEESPELFAWILPLSGMGPYLVRRELLAAIDG